MITSKNISACFGSSPDQDAKSQCVWRLCVQVTKWVVALFGISFLFLGSLAGLRSFGSLKRPETPADFLNHDAGCPNSEIPKALNLVPDHHARNEEEKCGEGFRCKTELRALCAWRLEKRDPTAGRNNFF